MKQYINDVHDLLRRAIDCMERWEYGSLHDLAQDIRRLLLCRSVPAGDGEYEKGVAAARGSLSWTVERMARGEESIAGIMRAAGKVEAMRMRQIRAEAFREVAEYLKR